LYFVHDKKVVGVFVRFSCATSPRSFWATVRSYPVCKHLSHIAFYEDHRKSVPSNDSDNCFY
jgi:hypothetical protein